MATLMIGDVTAKGTKEKVLRMFSALENYYDKYYCKAFWAYLIRELMR